MITLNNIKKTFRSKGNKVEALKGVTLTLPDNGIVILLGESGSGKSTLLNALGGLDSYEGSIDYGTERAHGDSINKFDEYRRLNVGYIFQDFYLNDDLSVVDNIRQGLQIVGITEEAEVKKRTNQALFAVSMSLFKKRLCSQLSLGQKQRIAIARSLAINPKIILADEPTGNLDSKNSQQIMRILKKISSNMLVVIVSHNESLAREYADYIYRIADGSIIKEEKLNNPKNPVNNIQETPLSEVHSSVDTIGIDLYKDQYQYQQTGIKILQKDGKTFLYVPNNITILESDFTKVSKEVVKEEEEKEGEFDNRHFDDSLKGKTVTKGLFFEKKRKKKDKRVLIRVISVVLSSILLIASNILATYYNTYRTDSNVHDYGYEYYVEVEQNSNYVIQSLPYFDEESHLLPYSTYTQIEHQRFDFARLYPGTTDQYASRDNFDCNLRGALSYRDELLGYKNSSDLKKGEIVIDYTTLTYFSQNSFYQEAKDVLGTYFRYVDPDGNEAAYKIVGFSHHEAPQIIFGGYTQKEVEKIYYYRYGKREKTLEYLANAKYLQASDIGYSVMFSGNFYFTPSLREKIAKEDYALYGSSSSIKDNLLSHLDFLKMENMDVTFESEDFFSEDVVIYDDVNTLVALLKDLISFSSSSFSMGHYYSLTPKILDSSKVKSVKTLKQEKKKNTTLRFALNSKFYRRLKDKGYIIDENEIQFLSLFEGKEAVIDTIFEDKDGENGPLFMFTDEKVISQMTELYTYWSLFYLSNDNYSDEKVYVLTYTLDPNESKRYLENRAISYMTSEDMMHSEDEQKIQVLIWVAIIFVFLFFALLYIILYRASMVSDIRFIGIYRCLGVKEGVFYRHYFFKMLKNYLFFLVPFLFYTIVTSIDSSVTPALIVVLFRVLGPIVTLLMLMLVVYFALHSLLKKTPHEIMTKYDI